MGKRIVVCGVGNRLYGDDGIGPEALKDIGDEVSVEGVLLLDCSKSPQDYTMRVVDFRPDMIIIISALDMKKGAGMIERLDVPKAARMLHEDGQVDLEMFIGYLRRALDAEMVFIGVQPWSRKHGHGLSAESRSALLIITEMVKELIGF